MKRQHNGCKKEDNCKDGESAVASDGVDGHFHAREPKCKNNSNIPSMHLRVAIIGAGIGGLSAALALQQASREHGLPVDIIVLESISTFSDRRQGYGLTLTNNDKGPLAKLGLLNECQQGDCASTCHYIFQDTGKVLGYYGRALKGIDESIANTKNSTDHSENENNHNNNNNNPNNGVNMRGNLRIPRQDLCRMLMSRIQGEVIHWGFKFLGYEENEKCVTSLFETEMANYETCMMQKEFSSWIVADENGDNIQEGNKKIRFRISSDVLVGCDGIRSLVRVIRDYNLSRKHKLTLTDILSQDKYEFFRQVPVTPLRFIGVGVIIGLSTCEHFFNTERGFYVLDGCQRMFTMPFRPARHGGSNDSNTSEPPLTMWQLSFAGISEMEAMGLRKMSPEDLISEALRRTSTWFPPIQDMITSTSTSEVWGTPLFDRDAMILAKKEQSCRVTVLGDACHPMSMFKGQGANQSLGDAPLLASWICNPDMKIKDREALFTRLRCFEREMVAKSTPKVMASREAARTLHTMDILKEDFGVEGWKHESPLEVRRLISELEKRNVTAYLGADIDRQMSQVIADLEKQMTTIDSE